MATFIATAGGAGFLPRAPGTWGSVVGLILALWVRTWPNFFVQIGFWIVLLLVGTWAAGVFDQRSKTQDNQKIVIDEVLGVAVAAATAPSLVLSLHPGEFFSQASFLGAKFGAQPGFAFDLASSGLFFWDHWGAWVVAFLCFRFFDIVKLPPVRKIDQWSKMRTVENVKWSVFYNGFGVVADDLVAGCQALVVVWFFQKIGIFL